MKLDLARIRQPQTRYDRTFDPSEIQMADDAYQVIAPVRLGFDIHKDHDKFRLVGTVRTELELPCSRCLEPFRLPVNAPFDLLYLPAAEASTATEREVGDEDLE